MHLVLPFFIAAAILGGGYLIVSNALSIFAFILAIGIIAGYYWATHWVLGKCLPDKMFIDWGPILAVAWILFTLAVIGLQVEAP